MKRLLFAAILCLSSCCNRGGYYEMQVCDQWESLNVIDDTSVSADPILIEWWQVFGDPVLEQYIALAAANNRSIKEACARIMEARANRRYAAGALWPQINAIGRADRIRISENSIIPFKDLAALGIPIEQNLYTVGFDALWEIDIFGKTLDKVEAAQERTKSLIESRNDILITVFAEVSRNYIEARGLQNEIAIKERKIDLLKQSAELIGKRKKSGLDNALKLESIDAELSRTRSELPLLLENFYISAFQLSALLGMEPQYVVEELKQTEPLPWNPDVVPVGLRSDLLRRRPDVRRAERDMAAYYADVRVAIKQILPSFSLFADVGYQATTLGKLFQSNSLTYDKGGEVSWSIFQGGALRANIAASKARACGAVYHYEQVILDALAETESAIVVYGKELEREFELRKTAESQRRLFELNRDRYRKGLIQKLDFFNAERQYLDAEESLIVGKTNTLTSLISLYKALGGGWE